MPPARSEGDLLLAVDRSMGRLARWLRLLGYDTEFDPDMDEGTLVRLAGQGRVVLTRTQSVAGKIAPSMRVVVKENDPRRQLAQVGKALNLAWNADRVFGRCLACNRLVEPLEKEGAAGRVPDYVLATREEFFRCPKCFQVFWKGTHQGRAMEKFKKILARDE